MRIAWTYRLVARGGSGVSCDPHGISLGSTQLVCVGEAAGAISAKVACAVDIALALEQAYGVQSEEALRRCSEGLRRAACALEARDVALASLEVLMLKLPTIDDDGMDRLARCDALRKLNDHWQQEPRVAAGEDGAGRWTTGGAASAPSAQHAGPPTAAGVAALPDQDPTRQKKGVFVADHLEAAKQAAATLRVPVENILGVSALESQWGESNFAAHQNYFGVHYPAAFAAGSFPTQNPDVRGAIFASYGDCLKWFVQVAGPSVQGKSDPSAFAAALQDSGRFGIDPETGSKKSGYVSGVAATIRGLRPYLTGQE
jgi:hypothetical protein